MVVDVESMVETIRESVNPRRKKGRRGHAGSAASGRVGKIPHSTKTAKARNNAAPGQEGPVRAVRVAGEAGARRRVWPSSRGRYARSVNTGSAAGVRRVRPCGEPVAGYVPGDGGVAGT